jgi:hypothetical protein
MAREAKMPDNLPIRLSAVNRALNWSSTKANVKG